jgi:carboxyl-terminal processing protease
VGVIALNSFYGPSDDTKENEGKNTATKDVAELIGKLQQQGIKALVIDLRRNGGGLLSEAVDLTGLFIKQGPVVQVKDSLGHLTVDSDNDPAIAYAGPLTVLTSRFSASASEIFAGALQNYGRAVIIGDSTTHGKGTVQAVLEMKNYLPRLSQNIEHTGAAKLTVQKFYLPNGSSTQKKGVTPDITLPSIEDCLPIGESDLPRALVWDQIPTSIFAGEKLITKVLSPLRQASQERQAKLEEFTYLRRYVDWFKSKQEQKLISVNLDERRAQKAGDDIFRKELKAEKERIAKDDYAFKTFYLGAPPPPRIKAPKKDADDDEFDDFEENETYLKADVHLREALRVVNDAIELGKNSEAWASTRAPLTALSSKGG